MMAAQISPIKGYEYEIWCVEKNGNKIVYAFNKDEMQEEKKLDGVLKRKMGL